MYHDKVVAFFDQLFDPQFAGKPFMRHYLDYYFDLYWDLHVGVQGAAIPADVRQIGESFNTVLAYRNPRDPIVYEHYMKVRAKLDCLKTWIAARVDDVATGKVAHPEKTFVYYWLKNAGDGAHFSRKDVVFEAFHNFVALSQWGNTMFGIMSRLSTDGGNPDVRAAFSKAMSASAPAVSDGGSVPDAQPFTPLELFVMELFRTISPNGGSLSAVVDARASQYGESPYSKLRARFERHLYAATPHTSTSMDPLHWTNPQKFDPDRYKTVPTSAQIDEAKAKADGLSEMSVRRHVDQGRRRAQRRDHEQRIRHGVRRGRRKADAGLRLRGLRPVRVRLSPVSGRTAHDPGVRGLLTESVEGQDRVRESAFAESEEGAGRSDGGDRRRDRLQARVIVRQGVLWESAQTGILSV